VEFRILIPEENIRQRVQELANEITMAFENAPVTIISILKGAIVFTADLIRFMKSEVELDFIRVKSYGMSDTSSESITLTKDLEISVEGKNVILVEDIIDTGLTVKFLYDYLKQFKPKNLKICALIDKKERRKVEIAVDYIGFEIEKGFLVGYGLDFAEKYRHLPEVYEVIRGD
jgi:hypoxanthine phosphoribosyltransferase